MPISAGLREDIAVYRGFIGQQYFYYYLCCWLSMTAAFVGLMVSNSCKANKADQLCIYYGKQAFTIYFD